MSGISDSSLNQILTTQKAELSQDIDTIIQKTQYVANSAASLMAINKVLFFIYAFLVVILLIGFLNRGIRYGFFKLNLAKEFAIFIALLLFPFIADSVEKFIYSFVVYVYSMITGTVYVNRFDKLFNPTDFYYNPHKK